MAVEGVSVRSRLKSRLKSKTSSKTSKAKMPKAKLSSVNSLPKDLVLKIHNLMVKSRVLEERLIKIYKAGDAYFWIGAPGEEGFGVPLGLLVNKGQGPKFDYLHLHYRATPTLVAMGMPMIDSIRLIMNKKTDPHTGGRNFCNHYCIPKWNVAPISSPIEVQYPMALGTAHVQKRHSRSALTVVTGGDAGTAEGDFASCLVWASRPGHELPILISVQNNRWGISTDYDSQHGELHIADRGKAFRMRTAVINGNDPIESYIRLKEEMDYIRKNQKPVLLEAKVSRLYGHSSATGANLIPETDCLMEFQEKLLSSGHLTSAQVKEVWSAYEQEGIKAQDQVRLEGPPESDSVWEHYYADGENGDWRKF